MNNIFLYWFILYKLIDKKTSIYQLTDILDMLYNNVSYYNFLLKEK